MQAATGNGGDEEKAYEDSFGSSSLNEGAIFSAQSSSRSSSEVISRP
jgi:hypothetical protein